MTRQYSRAKTGMDRDIRLHIRHGSTPDLFEIFAMEDFTMPDLAPPRVDVTHMRSPGGVGEEINGPRNAADLQIPLQYWEDLPNEADILTLIASGEVVEFLVTIGGTFRGYAAKIMHYQPTDQPMRDKGMATLNLSVMAEISNPTALPA